MASWTGQVSNFLKEQWAWEAFLVGEKEMFQEQGWQQRAGVSEKWAEMEVVC